MRSTHTSEWNTIYLLWVKSPREVNFIWDKSICAEIEHAYYLCLTSFYNFMATPSYQAMPRIQWIAPNSVILFQENPLMVSHDIAKITL